MQIRRSGFSISSSTGAAGGLLTRGGYFLKPLTFNDNEALALFMSAKALLDQEGFPYRDSLQSALQKIAGAVAGKNEEQRWSPSPSISMDITSLKDYTPWGSIFNIVSEAIKKNKQIEMRYNSYSNDRVAERLIDPYHVMFKEGFWYLVGHCHTRNEIRTFRLDRIENACFTGEGFKPPRDFNIKEYLGKSWRLARGEEISLTVRFHPPVSRLIKEGVWHPTQRLEELPDGSLLFHAEVEGDWEVKKWILGWGPAAEVLEPGELREDVCRDIKEMFRRCKV